MREIWSQRGLIEVEQHPPGEPFDPPAPDALRLKIAAEPA